MATPCVFIHLFFCNIRPAETPQIKKGVVLQSLWYCQYHVTFLEQLGKKDKIEPLEWFWSISTKIQNQPAYNVIVPQK